MKKNILLITLIVLLGCFLFVSCDSEAAAPQTDELVKVAFVESTSKGLSQSFPSVGIQNHYWKYTAVKKDGSSLTTGATGTTHSADEAQWVAMDGNTPKKGLAYQNEAYQVPGFSRGLWEFKLYGYSDAEGSNLVYTGTSSTVSLTKVSHEVPVSVSMSKTDGNGTLVIDKGITITNKSNEAYTNLSSGVARNYAVYSWNGSVWSSVAVNSGVIGSEDVTVSNLTAGDYKIIITYTDGTYTYGSGEASFVIFNNVTTKITGSVGETTTYAQFEATSNVINETASSKSFSSSTTEVNTVEIKYESSESESTTTVNTVTAEVPLTAAKTLLSQVVDANASIKADSESTSDITITNEMVLTLAVSTESSTETSATYNIDMNYVLTNTVTTTGSSENPVVTQVNGQVSTLDEYTTVMVKLPANLENVQFLHSNLTMKKTNSGNAIDSLAALNAIGTTNTPADEQPETDGVYPGYMWYDATTGYAYLRTKSFSPFSVTYEVPKYVASIGTTFYTTLEAAFDAASDGDTIVLLDDITQDNGYQFDKTGMTITLDTNRKTITVNSGSNINNRAFRIDNGTLIVNGKGSIVAVGSGTTKSNGSGCYGAFRVEADGKLIASDLTLTNARPNGLNVKVCGGEAELTKVTIESSYGGGIEVTEETLGNNSKIGTATLTDCDFTQEGFSDWCSSPLNVSGGSQLIVNSGTYKSENYVLYVFSSGGTITVNGGTFAKGGVNVDLSKKGIMAEIDLKSYPSYSGGLRINGGTFSCDYSIKSPAYMSITGGTFAHDPSAYVADGYFAAENDPETGKYTVYEAVASITDSNNKTTYFKSLQDAIDSVESNGATDNDFKNEFRVAFLSEQEYAQELLEGVPTIILLKNVNDASGLATQTGAADANPKVIIIDFNNHSYSMKTPAVGSTGTETQSMHWGAGSFIVMKNGTFTVQADAQNVKMAAQLYGTLVLDNMIMDFSNIGYSEYSGYTGTNAKYNGLPIPSFNTNGGLTIIKDSTVKMNSQLGKYACCVSGGDVDLFGVTHIVNGGFTFDEPDGFVYQWGNTVDIVGGFSYYFDTVDDNYEVSSYENITGTGWDEVFTSAKSNFIVPKQGPSANAPWPMYQTFGSWF